MYCVAIQDEYNLVQEIYGPYNNTNECMMHVDKMSRMNQIPEGWKFKIFPMFK